MNIAWFSLSLVFDQLDVVSYEEVVRLPAFKRKTLVLIGIFSLLCSFKYISVLIFLPVSYNLPPSKKKGSEEEKKKNEVFSWVLHIEQIKEFSESLPYKGN